MNIVIISDDLKSGKETGGNIRLLKLIKYFEQLAPNWSFHIYTINTGNKIDFHNSNCVINVFENKFYNWTIKNIASHKLLFHRLLWKILTFAGTIDYLWVPFTLSRIIKRKSQLKYDIILLQVPSILNIIYGIILKKKLKIPLVYDLRDDLINFQKLFFIKILERKMVKYASAIVCVTLGSQQKLASNFPYYLEKIFYIPNGFDLGDIPDIKLNKDYYKKTTIIYTGSIYKSRLEICNRLFNEIRKMSLEDPKVTEKVQILFYTESCKIQKLIQKYQIENLVFVMEPVTESLNYFTMLKNAHALLSMNFNTQYSIPGKLYEYLVMNNHIIHIDNFNIAEEVMQYFPQSKLLLLNEIADFKDILYNLIQTNVDSPEENNAVPTQSFLEIFHRKNIAFKYFHLLKYTKY